MLLLHDQEWVWEGGSSWIYFLTESAQHNRIASYCVQEGGVAFWAYFFMKLVRAMIGLLSLLLYESSQSIYGKWVCSFWVHFLEKNNEKMIGLTLGGGRLLMNIYALIESTKSIRIASTRRFCLPSLLLYEIGKNDDQKWVWEEGGSSWIYFLFAFWAYFFMKLVRTTTRNESGRRFAFWAYFFMKLRRNCNEWV